MSQPRRKRRRRRKPRSEQATSGQIAGQPAPETQRGGQADAGSSRRRRRGAAASGGGPAKQVSSEDLVRKAHAPRPKTLSAPPDGQKLEEIIHELQSVWGVPQYPQEYRLTLKVADERDARWARRAPNGGGKPQAGAVAAEPNPVASEAPKRERAPAAPRMGTGATDGTDASEEAPARRKRSRRRRRGRRSP
jgi:hypothetical protein